MAPFPSHPRRPLALAVYSVPTSAVSPRSLLSQSIHPWHVPWTGWHHVAVFLQVGDPKGMSHGPESHQGAAPERGAAHLGSKQRGTGGRRCSVPHPWTVCAHLHHSCGRCQPCERQGRETSDSGAGLHHHSVRDQQVMSNFSQILL